MIQQPDSSGKRCKNDYPQLLSNTIKLLTTSGCTSWGAFFNMDEQEKQRGGQAAITGNYGSTSKSSHSMNTTETNHNRQGHAGPERQIREDGLQHPNILETHEYRKEV